MAELPRYIGLIQPSIFVIPYMHILKRTKRDFSKILLKPTSLVVIGVFLFNIVSPATSWCLSAQLPNLRPVAMAEKERRVTGSKETSAQISDEKLADLCRAYAESMQSIKHGMVLPLGDISRVTDAIYLFNETTAVYVHLAKVLSPLPLRELHVNPVEYYNNPLIINSRRVVVPEPNKWLTTDFLFIYKKGKIYLKPMNPLTRKERKPREIAEFAKLCGSEWAFKVIMDYRKGVSCRLPSTKFLWPSQEIQITSQSSRRTMSSILRPSAARESRLSGRPQAVEREKRKR